MILGVASQIKSQRETFPIPQNHPRRGGLRRANVRRLHSNASMGFHHAVSVHPTLLITAGPLPTCVMVKDFVGMKLEGCTQMVTLGFGLVRISIQLHMQSLASTRRIPSR